ncbi:MAG: polyprenyl synthetase family protein [Roseivirga sp.]|uniref:polyprenyl synthetase family protein n=1 Tax=Roseivirga sp. TaxID=1964215 RepID=UPI001B04DF34|nr:polyprenyl synthetase family protein [Roseivirga sp.]MBO6661530.1 polyprenyl synthetase family protein [Roseivirga sp.]MBO6761397.1 polyprenyl synthetase family protein [Roseivirga sp.]MBO6908486.1 polyprenyl synthetase family protein [Roseivirga sp.]
MTNDLKALIGLINNRLTEHSYGEQPNELYEPIRYIMSLGGKRLRPVLVLLAYKLFKDDHEAILDQALAVEVFHNFTLMHDDIMDDAPLRRGKQTVHEKWDSSTAILSGDVMLVRAYDLLLDAPGDLRVIIKAFNECAAGVCEGQQFDMNFETMSSVTEEDYINMIRLKTAVLLGFSLQFGAMLAGASEASTKALYKFGVDIGIGFQLKDDLLDVYADQEKFGKQVGGDIISNKKTFLLLKALELANKEQKTQLTQWIDKKEFDSAEKVEAVTAIYDQIGIKELTLGKMNEYFNKGFESLDKIEVAEERKTGLKSFAQYLIERDK